MCLDSVILILGRESCGQRENHNCVLAYHAGDTRTFLRRLLKCDSDLPTHKAGKEEMDPLAPVPQWSRVAPRE